MAESNGQTPGMSQTFLRTMQALLSRTQLGMTLGNLFGGRRNLHEILGYVPVGRLTYAHYKARYRRQDIAQRIIHAYPEATWGQTPQVLEDTKAETDTPFEAAWKGLEARLHCCATLERADILAGLGQYSVVLLGLRNQGELQQPASPVRGPDDVLYLLPYSEEFVEIAEFESDPTLPTFAQPKLYRLNTGSTQQDGQRRPPPEHRLVHASRVIHIVDALLDDEIYGLPRLERVYDRLDDLLKVVGGGSEAAWIDARRRLVFALRDEYRVEAGDEQALQDEVDEFVHDGKPFVRVQGMDVNALNGQVANLHPQFSMVMDLIAGAVNMPKRLLIGSEQGELAGSQDERRFLTHVIRRQVRVAEPRMLRPLIDRLLLFQALPAPAIPYQVQWPNIWSLTETEQATIAQHYATALSQAYAAMDFPAMAALSRTLIEGLGYDPEDPLLHAELETALLPAPQMPQDEL